MDKDEEIMDRTENTEQIIDSVLRLCCFLVLVVLNTCGTDLILWSPLAGKLTVGPTLGWIILACFLLGDLTLIFFVNHSL